VFNNFCLIPLLPGSSSVKTRRSRDLIPKTGAVPMVEETEPSGKRRRTKVDTSTMVSKSFVKNNQSVQHLLALKSIAEDVSLNHLNTIINDLEIFLLSVVQLQIFIAKLIIIHPEFRCCQKLVQCY
jgi:hypothetical protein